MSRIVVIGAVEGRLDVFDKLEKLHRKTSFSVALILGDLFADPSIASHEDKALLASLLDGAINIPVPTYFTLGRYPLALEVQAKLADANSEVCHNLYFLGKRSTLKISEGLKIVALGGSLASNLTTGPSSDEYYPFYTESDANALQTSNDTHILLTTQWPAGIRSGSKVISPDSQIQSEKDCIAKLCAALRPRYHFSSSPHLFFEREPFQHVNTDSSSNLSHVTRFISMASYRNPAKEKWLYAFSFNTGSDLSLTLPAGTTMTPFATNSRKPQRQGEQDESYRRFSRTEDSSYGQRSSKRRRNNAPPPGPESCFFCLSNPNLATHLITSIGNESYLTTAKGPLSTAKTFPSLGFPAHILIIPLSHSPTFKSMSASQTRLSTFHEMCHYREALQCFVHSTSSGTLGTVCWEISRSKNVHTHWQLLPVPITLIRNNLVEAGFKVEAENEKYPLMETQGEDDLEYEEGDFLRVWMWHIDEIPNTESDGDLVHNVPAVPTGKQRLLVLPLNDDFRFDLQFPRKVMAKLLGLEGRMHWQDCAQEEVEEKAEAEAFKKAFEPFDFSLSDEA